MFKTITLITVALMLVGCGSRIDSMARTIDYAIFGEDDVSLTTEQIEALAYPHQYLTIGEQPRIALALGFDDNGMYKWLSGNREVLTTLNGRVVNTQGLTDGVAYVENLKNDPLTCITKRAESCVLEWASTVQFGRSYKSRVVELKGSFFLREITQVQLPAGNVVIAEHWQETIVSDNGRWTNHFWVSADNRRVIKSMQKWALGQPVFKFEELKAYDKDIQGAASE